MNPNAVDAVVVSYDSASTIDACLRALLVQPELASVRVVDNGSRDDTVRRVEAAAAGDPRIILIRQPGNPGFAAGCNAGARAVARGETSPWLLFVNPDLELPADALAQLLAHAAAHPKLGALGAEQRDAGGHRDPAARRRDLSLSRMLFAAGRRGALDVECDAARV
ncbi:MAG: glycosyltransferase, partial [Silanimonas sp.]